MTWPLLGRCQALDKLYTLSHLVPQQLYKAGTVLRPTSQMRQLRLGIVQQPVQCPHIQSKQKNAGLNPPGRSIPMYPKELDVSTACSRFASLRSCFFLSNNTCNHCYVSRPCYILEPLFAHCHFMSQKCQGQAQFFSPTWRRGA